MREQILTLLWTTAIGVALATSARAESPADLVPATVGVYLQIDNAAEIRAAYKDDDMLQQLRKWLPDNGKPANWRDLEVMMGLSSEQIIDRYFGQSVALVADRMGDGAAWMLISKVAAADIQLLKKQLQLKAINNINGFDAYATSDDKGRMAFGRGWMIVTDRRHEKTVGDVINNIGKAAPLSKDPTFQATMLKLPPGTAMAYVRDDASSEMHAVSITRANKDLSVHYVGRSERFENLFSQLGDQKQATVGPLPATTLAAMSFNISPSAFKPRDMEKIDRVLGSKTYAKDVAPKLGSPLVVFLGDVPGDEVTPKIDMRVPAYGVAIPMKDPTVAADLNAVIDSLIVIANVSTLDWGVAPITTEHLHHQKDGETISYRAADIGSMLSQRMKRPEMASMRLTYGQIGEWYVITTQHPFFKQCIEADGKALLAKTRTDANQANANPADQPTPIAEMIVNSPAIAASMQSWLNYWQANRPQLIASAKSPNPNTPEAGMVRGIMLLNDIFKHHNLAALNVKRTKSGDLSASLKLQRNKN